MTDRIKFRMRQEGNTGEFDLIVDGQLVGTGFKIADDILPLFMAISSFFRYWLPQRGNQPPALKG